MIDEEVLKNNHIEQGYYGLEMVLKSLDAKITFREKASAFGRECKDNALFEVVCIMACEIGELGGEVFAYNSSAEFLRDNMNEFGLFTGITLGGTYALAHVWNHAKKHSKNPSLIDAASYAGATESSCVVAATGTEYSAGKFIGTALNPFTGINLAIRLAALPVAFLIGTAAMSSLTFRKKSEAFRFISERDALRDVAEILEDKDCSIYANYHSMKINGKDSYVKISERKLPRSYRDGFNPDNHSLYLVTSPAIRYLPELKRNLETLATEFFTEAGKTITPVGNPFVHDHSHKNSHSHE